MLKPDMPVSHEALEKTIDIWIDWQRKMVDDETMVYTRDNIIEIDLIHYHTTEVPYFQGDAHYCHFRLNLDDELAFVDLFFCIEGADELKFMLTYVDTEWLTIPLTEEN